MFPHVVESRQGNILLIDEIERWIAERDLREANQCGKGDYLYKFRESRGYSLQCAFKDPHLAMMFKLTWG